MWLTRRQVVHWRQSLVDADATLAPSGVRPPMAPVAQALAPAPDALRSSRGLATGSAALEMRGALRIPVTR